MYTLHTCINDLPVTITATKDAQMSNGFIDMFAEPDDFFSTSKLVLADGWEYQSQYISWDDFVDMTIMPVKLNYGDKAYIVPTFSDDNFMWSFTTWVRDIRTPFPTDSGDSTYKLFTRDGRVLDDMIPVLSGTLKVPVWVNKPEEIRSKRFPDVTLVRDIQLMHHDVYEFRAN